jgi:hypothetical protein
MVEALIIAGMALEDMIVIVGNISDSQSSRLNAAFLFV